MCSWRAGLLLLLACGACTSEAAILLDVDGDLETGSEIDGIEASAWRHGAQLWSAARSFGPDDGLPVELRIPSSASSGSSVELRVAGLLDHRAVLEASRSTSFVEGREIEIEVCLWRRCIGSEDEACREGTCEQAGVDGDADGDVDVRSDAEGQLCNDLCLSANDGTCDDGGPGSGPRFCPYGSDCSDCGPRDPDGCVPSCAGRACGTDGCGGICPPGCARSEGCMMTGQCVEWIEVDAGAPFTVGPSSESTCLALTDVPHQVVLTHGFELAAREVSQAWFEAATGRAPSAFDECGPDCPVDNVSWHMAAAFCNEISRAEGLARCYECSGQGAGLACELASSLASPYECEGYRLPTESEWELAARAGTSTDTYAGDLDAGHTRCETPNPVLDPIAWFCGNSPAQRTHPRGLLEPNGFGFYDILGNVAEHCQDWHAAYGVSEATDPWGPATGTRRVVRGGSYFVEACVLRSAVRRMMSPEIQAPELGFRPARTLHAGR